MNEWIVPRLSQGFISKPRIGNEMWEEILELNRGSWRKRLRWIVKTSGNTSIIENLIPLRSFLHFSQLQNVNYFIWFNIKLFFKGCVPIHVVAFEFIGTKECRQTVIQTTIWSPEPTPNVIPHPRHPALWKDINKFILIDGSLIIFMLLYLIFALAWCLGYRLMNDKQLLSTGNRQREILKSLQSVRNLRNLNVEVTHHSDNRV